jgi:hypothetical protein
MINPTSETTRNREAIGMIIGVLNAMQPMKARDLRILMKKLNTIEAIVAFAKWSRFVKIQRKGAEYARN